MDLTVESKDLQNYLNETPEVDFSHPEKKDKARELFVGAQLFLI
ncbi:hypothetical protein GCM10011391_18120 [Pullulanibacillus camelliae]|uniref:Uncharacterized protein n=1 Tax=Pullulanibacillus camelliae TaxID=1707096 RepID=A0A8J2YF01_9BACL|nr:hypothetical protein [Pullulanibacillus camelliae]GGE39677.1 hypothetical protein GCM10011391_18120 [Pullulanibacillus camelliae]